MSSDPQAALAGALLPLQPLVVRDGRNFDLGSKARTLPWPYPSVLAGAVRSLIGRQGEGEAMVERLKQLQVRGPFPWDGEKLYLPAPADMHLTAVSGKLYDYERLVPGDATQTPLPPQAAPDKLRAWLERLGRYVRWYLPPAQAAAEVDPAEVVLPTLQVKKLEKTPPGPAWWSSSDYLAWATPRDRITLGQSPPFATGLPTAVRTHARIDSLSGKNDEVFQTTGLDFTRRPDETTLAGRDYAARQRQWAPLGLAVDVRGDANCLQHLSAPLMTTLGGERRAAWWEPGERIADALAMRELTRSTAQYWRSKECRKRLRAVLLTPAYFRTGWWPDWLSTASCSGVLPGTDLRLTLVAAATRRWSGVSGWDMELNRPKPTRRLVPAGSVFYFKVAEGLVDFEEIHMISLCSGEQSRRDGFGLALWGVE